MKLILEPTSAYVSHSMGLIAMYADGVKIAHMYCTAFYTPLLILKDADLNRSRHLKFFGGSSLNG